MDSVRDTPTVQARAPRRIAAPLLVVLALAACGDSGPPPEVVSGAGAWDRDLLDDGRIVTGESIATSESVVVTRGTWQLKSSNGSAEAPVKDDERGGFPLGTILIGSGVDGKGERTIGIGVPQGLEPDRARIRFLATEGESLKLRLVLIGREGAVPGDLVDHAPTGKPVTLDFDLPRVEGLSNAVLEIGGDCVRPTFTEILLVRTIPASQELLRSVQGPLDDPRRAVGLGPGAAAESPIELNGASRVTLSAMGDQEGSGTLRISVLVGKEAIAEADRSYDASWEQVALDVPEAAGAAVLRIENTGRKGVWIAEDRVDRGTPPPPVLLITSDTHRGDYIGTFGEAPPVKTPTLDALAASGVVFTNCFAPTNVTNPSHMALMTGLPLRDTRVTNNATSLSRAATTIAEEFQRAGYRTFAATSVMHLKPSQSGLDQGFDRYDAPDQGKRNGRIAVDRLREWIPDAAGAPLFVWLHVYDAHAPYEPPKRLVSQHYSGDPKSDGRTLGVPEKVLAPWITRAGYTDPAYIDALYAGGVDYVDELVGRLLEVERLDDAIVAFTADHGESLGVDGVWWDHSRLNLDTVHIPLLLRAPGLEPGRTDAPVEQIDVGRTLIDMAGIESSFPGRNLEWALEDSPSAEPRFSLAAHGWSAAVEADGWMLVLQIRPYPRPFSEKTWAHGETELFDLREDPRATKNVLEENFERAKKMRTALVTWLLEAPEDGLGIDVELSDEAKASLEALGYGGGTTGSSEGRWWRPDPQAEWNRRFEE